MKCFYPFGIYLLAELTFALETRAIFHLASPQNPHAYRSIPDMSAREGEA